MHDKICGPPVEQRRVQRRKSALALALAIFNIRATWVMAMRPDAGGRSVYADTGDGADNAADAGSPAR